MASLREHIKNSITASGLHLRVAHQVNLAQFLKASMRLERKCNNYFKGGTSNEEKSRAE